MPWSADRFLKHPPGLRRPQLLGSLLFGVLVHKDEGSFMEPSEAGENNRTNDEYAHAIA